MVLQNKTKWELLPHMCETPWGPSETVPDDALTIKQILAKHMAGQALAAEDMRTPIYQEGSDHDSEDLEAINRMDISEKHELAQRLQADILAKNLKISEAEKERKAKKLLEKKNAASVKASAEAPASETSTRKGHAAVPDSQDRRTRNEDEDPGDSA